MKPWTKRLQFCMTEKNMSNELLARKLGVTRGAITHYMTGRRQPPLGQFQKLAAILKVDPAWLLYGTDTKSEPMRSEAKNKATQFPIPILSWNQTVEFANVMKLEKHEIKEFVPNFYLDKPEWFALRVQGDSMTAAHGSNKSFHEGDIIIIDPTKKPSHGSFVVALLPKAKEATFKQLVVDGGVKFLKPLNTQYPMQQIEESAYVCGVVVACLSCA